MKRYLILIHMDDGSVGRARGQFRSDWEAIDTILGSDLQGMAAVVVRREAACA
ncbi:hypothetical protein M4R23_08950 [Acidovorax sp. GBBC 3332]|nr:MULTISPECIES: hypothetical protein [unclassified Acidovorax]MDA8449810.1 hypothetical protein [Acidovorax sp. GBBC 3297]MDA8459255.1 hypothetical protein [Acidovorax sp. GBBC 3333]MDA8464292.1 hypothetical protein [Acidovorax sp. GBBC 3332]MDA8469498.1 hypothetical protein [Acidovorax sp. GBBC 3299]